jgi:hypothetical protein
MITCADNVIQRCYSDILIASLDGKEACHWCGVRGANANHPCPKCTVHHASLHDLQRTWPLRTKDGMQEVFREACLQPTKGAKEMILKNSGLHDVDVRSFSSDSFQPYSYQLSYLPGSFASLTPTPPIDTTHAMLMTLESGVSISGLPSCPSWRNRV